MRFFILFFIIITQTAPLASATENDFKIETPYAYATSPVQKNGAAFMKIYNAVHQERKLVKAHTNIATRTELHTHIMDGDMMMMREVPFYALPAQSTVILKPMGHHIMLFDLKSPLKVGETFPLTLYFDDETQRDIEISIIKPGTKP